MIRNYLKTTLRIISRNKFFTFINVFGLSVGMACFILIFLWVKDELSFDRFHKNYDKIYRVVMEKETEGVKEKIARTPFPLRKALKEEFPEIKKCTRLFFIDLSFYENGEVYNEEGVFVDRDLFSIFDFKLIKGDTNSVFSSNYNIIISKKFALKIFNSTDVIGKSLKMDEENLYTISGVFEDIPDNSHLKFEYAILFDVLYDYGLRGDIWRNYNNTSYIYLMLDDKSNPVEVGSKIKNLIKEKDPELNIAIGLQPFRDIYLRSDYDGDFPNLGNMRNVYTFSLISLFIILIAGFNFMNLTTAQTSFRLKEITVRKIVGAKRKNLIGQFLGEAVFIAFVAHVFAIIMVELILPEFNRLTVKDLSINYFSFNFYLLIVLLIISIGLLSGSYPSFYLSGLNALDISKGKDGKKTGASFLRKMLVIIQFSISISLIIVSLTISLQLKFLNNKDLGFDKTNLVYFSLPDEGENYRFLKENLLKHPEIESVTVLSHELTDVVHLAEVTWEGRVVDEKVLMNMLWTDEDFISTMKMEMVRGSDFKEKHSQDTVASFILNEAAVRRAGLKNPIGKKIEIGRWKGYIRGVVKDFNFQPLYNEIKPMVLSELNHERFFLYARIDGSQKKKALSIIQNEFKNFSPNTPIDYHFLDDSIDELYKNENRLAKLVGYFTILAIAISCLGLLGLSTFMMERRTKEIGIRKAMGASSLSIMYLLSKQMFLWISIANIISWPLAYYFMNKWMQNFQYHIDINWWVFVLGSVIILIIALLSVIGRAYKTAKTNPVNALRYE